MNAPSVKFGIVSASAVNPAAANPKASGDTSVAFALELNALWLGGPDVSADTKDERVQPPGTKSCATKRETESPSRDAGQNVSLTGTTQWPVAYRQFAEASLETDQDAKAPVVPFAGQAEPAEPTAQPNLQTTPSMVTSPLSNLPAQLNLEGGDQPARAYGEFSDVSPLTSGEPKNGEQGSVKTPVSSSCGAEVTQLAESQVTADWPGRNFDQPDAELSSAPTMLQPPSAQPQVLVNRDADSTSGKPGSPDSPAAGMSSDSLVAGASGAFGTVVTHSENFLGQAQPPDSAGPQSNEAQNQDDGVNIAFNPLASSTELTSRGASLSRDIAIPHAEFSSVIQFSSPASDKSADSDRAGTSRDSNEGPSGSGNIAPADSLWTQEVGTPNSGSDVTSQGSQQGYLGDRTPTPASSKSAPFASAVQKASAAGSDTNSEMAVDPRQGMYWNSDAQNGPAPSSADSSISHAATFPNGDGAMERSVQNVSSARLADTTGQSEIQVNLKSDSWGPVSVHATLSNGQVGAEIQVSDRDAHAALTEALHTLEKNLGENGIQVSNLNVSHGLGYSHAQSQNQQEKQAGQSTYAARFYAHRSAVSDDIPVASKGVNSIDDFVLGRVSVRA